MARFRFRCIFSHFPFFCGFFRTSSHSKVKHGGKFSAEIWHFVRISIFFFAYFSPATRIFSTISNRNNGPIRAPIFLCSEKYRREKTFFSGPSPSVFLSNRWTCCCWATFATSAAIRSPANFAGRTARSRARCGWPGRIYRSPPSDTPHCRQDDCWTCCRSAGRSGHPDSGNRRCKIGKKVRHFFVKISIFFLKNKIPSGHHDNGQCRCNTETKSYFYMFFREKSNFFAEKRDFEKWKQ